MKNKVNLKSLIFAFLLIGIGVNIGQFKFIDEKLNDNYKALNISDSSYAAEVGTKKSPALRGYYLPWITLSKVAPNSNVIVPSNWHDKNSDSIYDLATLGRLRGFGDINSLSYKDIPEINISEILEDDDECIAASGENAREDLPYFVIILETQSCPKKVDGVQSGLYISSVNPVEVGPTLLLAPWEGPEKPLHPEGSGVDINERTANFYVTLIEVSLLPEDVQEELK